MQKIIQSFFKEQKINEIYKPFLKKDLLKNKKPKWNQVLFENEILLNLKRKNSYLIERNQDNNQFLTENLNKIQIYTIVKSYKNDFLIHSDLNYKTLYWFNKIFLKRTKKINYIKARILNMKRRIIFFSIFGFILRKKVQIKKRIKRTKKRKKNLKLKIFLFYKLRYLTFKIQLIKERFFFSKKFDYKEKLIFSRELYLNDIDDTEQNKTNKFLLLNKNKKYATIRSIFIF